MPNTGKSNKTFTILVLASMLLIEASWGTVLYVDSVNGSPRGLPNDPDNPWNSITTAVDDLLLDDLDDQPDIIRIAPGTYQDGGSGHESYPMRLNDDPSEPDNDITLIGWIGGEDGIPSASDQVLIQVNNDIPAPENTIVVCGLIGTIV